MYILDEAKGLIQSVPIIAVEATGYMEFDAEANSDTESEEGKAPFQPNPHLLALMPQHSKNGL